MAEMKYPMSNSKMFANWFSETGSRQALVSIYKDQAILYVQCSQATAKALSKELSMYRHLVLIENAEVSDDGLTWCWCFDRSKVHPGAQDWLKVAMFSIYSVLREFNTVLTQDILDYTDNRDKDANTIEAFAELVSMCKQ